MPIRYLDDKEIGNIEPLSNSGPLQGEPLQEQGVTTFERFVMKNLTTNPEAAKRYLQSLGYQVRDYGGKWNFAVRKSNSEPWKVVDPNGLDAQDILDFVGDFIGGSLTGAATAGGAALGNLPGAIAAGGGSGAAVELGRQYLGKLAGVPQDYDVAQAAASGVVGGAIPAAGAVLKPVGRALGNAGLDIGARFLGITGTEALPAREAMRVVLRGTPGKFPTRLEAAKALISAIKGADDSTLALSKEAEGVLDALPGATGNIRPILDRIREFTRTQAGGAVAKAGTKEAERVAKETSLATNADDLLKEIRTYLGDTRSDQVPARMIAGVKRILQRKARFDTEAPTGQEFRTVAREASHDTRSLLEGIVSDAGRADYIPTMRRLDKSLGLLDDFRKTIKDTTTAENYIKNVYGPGPEARIEALHDLERHFGFNVSQVAEQANAAARVGRRGVPPLLPKANLMSQLLGPASVPFMLATSPKAAMAVARTITGRNALGAPVAAALQATAPVTGSLARGIAQELGKQAVMQEDAPKKKTPKLILGGGY